MTTKTRVAAAPTAARRNRITGTGEEAPDQLLANPANWRIHPKAQQDALAGALDQVGWVQQVLGQSEHPVAAGGPFASCAPVRLVV
jgi:hypothetical protein